MQVTTTWRGKPVEAGWRHTCPIAGDRRETPAGEACPICGTTQAADQARTIDDRLAAALWWRIRRRSGERWIDQPDHVRRFWAGHAARLQAAMTRHGIRPVTDNADQPPAILAADHA